MVQPIQASGRVPYAEEALALSTTARGAGFMVPPNPGVKNAFDGSEMSKPYTNGQEAMTGYHARQGVGQNAITAAAQKTVGFTGEARSLDTEVATRNARTQQYLNQKLATEIDSKANGGAAIAQLNAIMSNPESKDKYLRDIAVSRLMNERGFPGGLGGMNVTANSQLLS